jgi:hypothetical protein
MKAKEIVEAADEILAYARLDLDEFRFVRDMRRRAEHDYQFSRRQLQWFGDLYSRVKSKGE